MLSERKTVGDQVTLATDRPSSRLVILMSYPLACYSWEDFNLAAYFLNHYSCNFHNCSLQDQIFDVLRGGCVRGGGGGGGGQNSDCAPGGTAAPNRFLTKEVGLSSL